MKSRVTAIMVALIMLISFNVVSYANEIESDAPSVPKAVALVTVDNPECIIYDTIPKDLKVRISIDNGNSLIAEIPVVKVEEEGDFTLALWLGYDIGESFTDEVIKQLEEIQKDLKLDFGNDLDLESMNEQEIEDLIEYMEEMETVLEKGFSAYTVEVIGLPEDNETHEFKTEAETIYLSNLMAKELVGFFKEIVGQLFQLNEEEINSINSFSGIIRLIENEFKESGLLKEGEDIIDFLYDGEATESVRAEFQKGIENLDNIITYIKSDEYKGTVITSVNLICGCPESIEYEIIHQYFKIKGDKAILVASEMYGPDDGYYTGITGDTVYAKDYVKCEYNGETYKYIGSYDSVVELYSQEEVDELYFDDSWWDEDEMDSFQLNNDDWDAPMGLVLRYELVEDSEIPVDNDGAPSKTAGDETAVDTGDNMNIAIPFAIAGLALIFMAVAVFTRRRVN